MAGTECTSTVLLLEIFHGNRSMGIYSVSRFVLDLLETESIFKERISVCCMLGVYGVDLFISVTGKKDPLFAAYSDTIGFGDSTFFYVLLGKGKEWRFTESGPVNLAY